MMTNKVLPNDKNNRCYITSLPKELLLLIVAELTLKDLINLINTNKKFQELKQKLIPYQIIDANNKIKKNSTFHEVCHFLNRYKSTIVNVKSQESIISQLEDQEKKLHCFIAIMTGIFILNVTASDINWSFKQIYSSGTAIVSAGIKLFYSANDLKKNKNKLDKLNKKLDKLNQVTATVESNIDSKVIDEIKRIKLTLQK